LPPTYSVGAVLPVDIAAFGVVAGCGDAGIMGCELRIKLSLGQRASTVKWIVLIRKAQRHRFLGRFAIRECPHRYG